jgi:alpha-beta hydrolase superfamily lysophospholipase
MKKTVFIFLFSLCNIAFSQKYSDFGKELSNKESYQFHEVNFVNTEDNTKLCGTLIIPKKGFTKVAIVVPGSGPNTRNSHYVLTEALLNNGIAVYRYDERGVGQSEGKYKFKENDMDLYYAFKKLKEIDSISKKSFGIIGHSMGGYYAINAYLKKSELNFLVLISTPISRDKNRKFEDNNKNKFAVVTILKNIEIPTLYIAGTQDGLFDAKKTITILNELGNKNMQIKLMEGLNHFLKLGNDDWIKTRDYKLLYEIDKNALIEIVNWINKI